LALEAAVSAATFAAAVAFPFLAITLFVHSILLAMEFSSGLEYYP
jgi:hypothetical protein